MKKADTYCVSMEAGGAARPPQLCNLCRWQAELATFAAEFSAVFAPVSALFRDVDAVATTDPAFTAAMATVGTLAVVTPWLVSDAGVVYPDVVTKDDVVREIVARLKAVHPQASVHEVIDRVSSLC